MIEAPIELPEDVYMLLREILYQHSGISLDDHARSFVQGRLQQTLWRHQFTSFREYYYFLTYDRKKDEELANMIDLLTVHETYFFREERQLRAFSEEVLLEVLKRNHSEKSLRIWSAGCSTGEEPYTISMILLDNHIKEWKIEIYASDISRRALQSARRGVYQRSSFRATPPSFISRYFHKEEKALRIDDQVKKNVIFLHLSLLDGERMALLPPMDIIFCRNVIIYFDKEAREKTIAHLHRQLKEGGFLLLGNAESLVNISTAFSMRHFRHDIVYQKGGRDGG